MQEVIHFCIIQVTFSGAAFKDRGFWLWQKKRATKCLGQDGGDSGNSV
jgi:hypothetical protein